jgi:2-polyprenyl-6-methoxyphenol hydroxylase-like FAD-dependent oxidoreductase
MLADGPPVYRGYTAWRGVAPASASPGLDAGVETWGCGRRFGMVPIDGGRVYWYATVNAPPAGSDTSRATLHALVGGWHAPIAALIDATPEDAILRADVGDRPRARAWVQERVALLGDAAHPMTPNLGQGACQAIEDAVVLTRCLADAPDAGALSAYEARRRARAEAAVRDARRLGAVAQWESPLACRLRDAAVATIPGRALRRSLAAAWAFEATALKPKDEP